MTASRGEGQVVAGESLFIRYINLVKLPHTLFALPFALVGVIAASRVAPVTWRTVLLVVVAFTAARWVAMGFNRIADLRFDAKHPRNAGRELPRGLLTVPQAWVSVIVAASPRSVAFVVKLGRQNDVATGLLFETAWLVLRFERPAAQAAIS